MWDLGPAMAEAVTSLSVWNPGNLCRICGGQSDNWDTFSSEYFGFALSVSFHQHKILSHSCIRTVYSKPLLLAGLHSSKNPQTMKLPCGNLISCGKNGFRVTRAKWNMIMCKWMINKMKTFVVVFIGVMMFLDRSCQDDQVMQTEWQNSRLET